MVSPCTASTAKQIGTRCGRWRASPLPGGRLSLLRTGASPALPSLTGRLLDEVDGLVDPVAVGAMAEDGDAEGVAAANGGAGEEYAAAGVDVLQDAGAVGVVEGDHGQLRLPRQLEVAGLLQAVVGEAGQVELLVERLLEGLDAVELEREPHAET